MSPRVALLTYSVKPRGGVVHTLELAEALHARGEDVTVVAMGDPDVGFFRPVDAPVHIVRAPAWGETLDERVFSWIDALEGDLAGLADRFDILHAQDCISARAAARVRDAGADLSVVRTVHHIDDFTTQALIDCQDAAITEPDVVLVVSEHWREIIRRGYDLDAKVITNGVRSEHFASPDPSIDPVELRRGIGAADSFLWITIGGIEPRKGSEHLVRALSRIKAEAVDAGAPAPVLAVIGGHSFQDHKAYRDRVLDSLDELGLEEGRDLVLLGTLSDAEVVAWLHAADAFAFPSVNEGWGLAPLEAMAAGLPVVISDLEVFGEFLGPDDAVITRTGDDRDLAGGMRTLMADDALRGRLASHGPTVAGRFSWDRTAQQHAEIYAAAAEAHRSAAVSRP